MREAGHDVVAEAGDADAFFEATLRCLPDLCVVDIRMPPMLDSDGIRAAHVVRLALPSQPILLSQHIETRDVLDLIGGAVTGCQSGEASLAVMRASRRVPARDTASSSRSTLIA